MKHSGEARSLLRSEFERLRKLPFEGLRKLIESPVSLEHSGSGGVFVVWSSAEWEGDEGGELRVSASIDFVEDYSSFRRSSRMSAVFVVRPDGRFVGEGENHADLEMNILSCVCNDYESVQTIPFHWDMRVEEPTPEEFAALLRSLENKGLVQAHLLDEDSGKFSVTSGQQSPVESTWWSATPSGVAATRNWLDGLTEKG